jgi:hypothetical protein
MKDNPVVDQVAVSGLVDWAAAEVAASRLGPHTQRLVVVRNVDALAVWLPRAAETSRNRAPTVADLYDELASLVGFAMRPTVSDVDRHGDVLGGAA